MQSLQLVTRAPIRSRDNHLGVTSDQHDPRVGSDSHQERIVNTICLIYGFPIICFGDGLDERADIVADHFLVRAYRVTVP
jgi:hypothetical protein